MQHHLQSEGRDRLILQFKSCFLACCDCVAGGNSLPRLPETVIRIQFALMMCLLHNRVAFGVLGCAVRSYAPSVGRSVGILAHRNVALIADALRLRIAHVILHRPVVWTFSCHCAECPIIICCRDSNRFATSKHIHPVVADTRDHPHCGIDTYPGAMDGGAYASNLFGVSRYSGCVSVSSLFVFFSDGHSGEELHQH